jgi:hypothetical protein
MLKVPMNHNFRLPRPGAAASLIRTAEDLFLSRSSLEQLVLEWVEVRWEQHL